MKILFYIFAFSTLTGCSFIKMANNQKFTRKSDTLNFELKNKMMMINVAIEDSTYDFFFDTGATPTAIFDTTIIKNYYSLEKVNFGIILMASGSGSAEKIAYNIKTELYSSTNQIVLVMIPEKKICSEKLTYKGIVGNQYFETDTAKVVKFDFDNKKIIIIKETQIKENLMEGFTEIKSDFFDLGYHFKIFLTINGIEEPFHFDTGNSGVSLLLRADSKIKLDNGVDYSGAIFGGADQVLNDKNKNTFYENVPIDISGQQINSAVAFSDFYQRKDNNVGLSFISQFNWIVDYKNEKVYFKKNSLNDEISISPFKKQYKAIDNGKGEIVIRYKLKNLTDYNVGDKLISIKGIKVSSENECEMLKLLDNTLDWKTLAIVIEKK